MTIAVRWTFLFFLRITGLLAPLWERAHYTEVGFACHVTTFDAEIAKNRKLKPLNRFEQWLLKPIIEAERERRREAMREAVIEVTGDDPDDWEL